jgi:tetratricopeptide (TPR) repeat protein
MPSATATHTDARNSRSWLAPLSLLLLLTICFCLAANLSLWYQNWQGNRGKSSSLLEVALGDARRMFANHFFVKADAYFHSGFYPSIYDNLESYQTPHIAEDSGATAGKNTGDEGTFLGPPRNWIDRFGRQFFPSTHTHLTEGGANGKEGVKEVGEMLPWLKLSQELDPKQVQTYTVTAYWLRSMGKIDDALDFLRTGLRENPGDPQLLFDLGRLYQEFRHDPDRARNVWRAGLLNLARLPAPKDEQEKDQRLYVQEQILGQLAQLEAEVGNTHAALDYLEQLKAISPDPQDIQKRIDELKSTPPLDGTNTTH